MRTIHHWRKSAQRLSRNQQTTEFWRTFPRNHFFRLTGEQFCSNSVYNYRKNKEKGMEKVKYSRHHKAANTETPGQQLDATANQEHTLSATRAKRSLCNVSQAEKTRVQTTEESTKQKHTLLKTGGQNCWVDMPIPRLSLNRATEWGNTLQTFEDYKLQGGGRLQSVATVIKAFLHRKPKIKLWKVS